MSEYQYYEFLAIDHPLDAKQRAVLRAMSTRATITSTSFINEYHWGDLKGDPRSMVAKYFDAFLYMANWNTYRLMFRVPLRLLDLETAQTYCSSDAASAWVAGDHLVIDFFTDIEYDGDWDDAGSGEGRLGAIVPARAELMAGNLHLLYLGWLMSADVGMLDDDELEPPVPPNFADLTGALVSAAEFLQVDPYLLEAAAEGSERIENNPSTDRELATWLARLPEEAKDELLLQVARGDAAFARADLLRRFKVSRASAQSPTAEVELRTVGELLHRAAQLRRAGDEREAAERAVESARQEREAVIRRGKVLDALAGEGERAWKRVGTLVKASKPREYDSAVSLLIDLRDLSAREGTAPDFNRRILDLRGQYPNRPALLRRFEDAGFVE